MALIKCPECGGEISDKAMNCPKCGCPISTTNNVNVTFMTPQKQESAQDEKVIIINNQEKSNGCATSGFVFAILGLLLGWIPVVGWTIWFIGLVLCIIGLFKTPRGLAIVGLIITFIDYFIIMAIVGGIASVLSTF